jgi:lysosomal acid lipase/cholesteryl ester hydrolase
MIYLPRLITCDVCFQDGVIWLLNSPDESLPFILVDSGFDVWLVSGRGSKYSSHISLTPNDLVVIFNDEFEFLTIRDFPHLNSRYW